MRPLRGELDLNDGLVGFDRHERLIGDHMIAFRGVPKATLSLLEAFTEDVLATGTGACWTPGEVEPN